MKSKHTEKEIQDAINNSYKRAGTNAYFSQGFRAGIEFADSKTLELQKSHAELLDALKLLVSDIDSYHTKEPMTWTQRKEKEFATSQYIHHCKQAIKNATK